MIIDSAWAQFLRRRQLIRFALAGPIQRCRIQTLARRADPVNRRRCADDRGSMSIFAIFLVMASVVLMLLVVDGSTVLLARQQANGQAREAARVAGQQIQAAPAIRGSGARPDLAAGQQAAQQYLVTTGASGSVAIDDGAVVVTIEVPYRPFLFSQLHGVATGRASAEVIDEIMAGSGD